MLPEEIDDPLVLLCHDQRRAAELGDPLASFATLATAVGEQPSARVVTLRRVTEGQLLVSANATSPKAHALRANPRCELLIYWVSLQRQYRLCGRAAFVAAAAVPELYEQVPWRSKTWDQVYETLPQSTPVAARADFVGPFTQALQALQARYAHAAAVPGTASAGYLEIAADVVELQALDLNERLHDRRRFQRDASGAWSSTWLVP